jgi:predicted SnoaL-like aldol condensation-catalyzing enzyme
MSNKELVKTAITGAFINHDLSTMEKYWSVDYIQHNPQVGNGLEGLKKVLSYLPKEFKYEMGIMAEVGEFVMVHGRATAWGPKPLIVVDIFRVKDGKIAEHWDVMQEEVAAENTASKNPMFPILQTAGAV